MKAIPELIVRNNKWHPSKAPILSQIKMYDAKRVKYKVGMINKDDFIKLYEKFIEVTKPEVVTPSKEGEPLGDSIDVILSNKSK